MDIGNHFVQDRKKKVCFIITPIGNETDPIRRHIDGLIDECIVPVINDKYEVHVSHRMSMPGSITNQVIAEIYNADLVVANLTNLNANVMYELAFRHAIRKPAIIIMQKDSGTLPFDTISERTIFYTNDFKGAIELKENIKNSIEALKSAEDSIVDNPIYTALEKIKVTEQVIKDISLKGGDDANAFNYIITSLQRLDEKVNIALKTPVQVINNAYEEELYIHEVPGNTIEAFTILVHNTLFAYMKEKGMRFTFNTGFENGLFYIALRSKDLLDLDNIAAYLGRIMPYTISQQPFR